MLALLRPPSMSGIDIKAPSNHERLLHLKTSATVFDAEPPACAFSSSDGNIAARATPMRALDASIVRCAAAISGRRSSSDDGMPAGIFGISDESSSGLTPAVKLAAGLPAGPPAHAR